MILSPETPNFAQKSGHLRRFRASLVEMSVICSGHWKRLLASEDWVAGLPRQPASPVPLCVTLTSFLQQDVSVHVQQYRHAKYLRTILSLGDPVSESFAFQFIRRIVMRLVHAEAMLRLLEVKGSEVPVSKVKFGMRSVTDRLSGGYGRIRYTRSPRWI